MARYTQLGSSDIREIIQKYELILVDFEPIYGGASNSSYCLQTDNNSYVLTVFDDKTKDYVTQLGHLLLQLEQAEFPTTRLKLPVSQQIPLLYGNKPIMLKNFIIGQTIPILDEVMIHQIGVALAALHQISPPDFLPKKHAYGLEMFISVIGQNVHPPFESWLSQQYHYLTQNIPLNLPRTLIHGDCFADNVLFEKQLFRAIIDFEEACHYYRVFDLGMAIIGLCTQNADVDLKKARTLLNGYQRGQKLNKSEKDILQLFVEYAATATAYWRFWKYYIHAPQAEMAEKPFEMRQLAETVKEIPKTRFLEAIFGES